MYATSTLLIVCGIPATAILSIVFMFAHDRSIRLDRSQALFFGGCMIAVEVVIAIILEFVARQLSKQGEKTSIRHDADA